MYRNKAKSQKLKAISRKYGVKRSNLIVSLLPFAFCLFTLSTNAQCAMCRAALTGDSNKVQAEAVNNGIVYLMVIPYLLVGAIGYYVYRMKKKK